MVKLVAFDWTGTLLSDTATCVKAENAALKAVGVKPITILKFRQSFDIPVVKYWENLGFTEQFLKKHLNTIEDVFHLTYENNSNHTRTRSGVKEVLSFLNKQKVLSVIYSNHNVPNIHRQLVRLGINEQFDKILANQKAGENKQVFFRHKEFLLKEFVKKHKFKPHEVVSVGDTIEEIQIGKSFGYHTVAITGGYNTTARLKKQKPDFLIHNLAELSGIIKKLNRQ